MNSFSEWLRSALAAPAPSQAHAIETLGNGTLVDEFAAFYRRRSKENPARYPQRNATATRVYEAYCEFCEAKATEPSALPTFARAAALHFAKSKIRGRVCYTLRPNA